MLHFYVTFTKPMAQLSEKTGVVRDYYMELFPWSFKIYVDN